MKKDSGYDDSLGVKLQRSYLGFVVIKPLPLTVIGRTCLKTYPPANGRRHFPITRTYNANLFGLSLIVESLAFQEQDTVAAACATSALWSIFQGTGKLFQHNIPSPLEITKAATDNLPLEDRAFPSKGLNATQMAHAVRNVGLEPLLIKVPDIYTLKATLYAYLKGKIPIALNFSLYDTTCTPNALIGFHAVAITGYSMGHHQTEGYSGTNFMLRATKIDKIYAHDDQIGPFAKMEIDGINLFLEKDGIAFEIHSLSTSWRGDRCRGPIGSARAYPVQLLIPLYDKIRIPFWSIHNEVYKFDDIVKFQQQNGLITQITGNLEWEIYLTTVCEFKNDVINNYSDLSADCRYDVLTRKMPRFIWIARAWNNTSVEIELLFDATDIEQGEFFIGAIETNKNFSDELRTTAPMFSASENRILRWFEPK